LIISDQPKFIFVAVPKTGTGSVEEALQEFSSPNQEQAFNKHVTCRQLIKRLPAEQWECAFKFAFVRNPYDWMYSWYRYRQRDELSDPNHKFHDRYTGNTSFNEFVQTFHTKEIMLEQSNFVSGPDGKLVMDFVGRYETMQQDFDQVCDRLGITRRNLPWVNASKPASSEREPLDRASLDILNKYFNPDFKLFGYSKE